jgi:hypothetical protein
MDRYIFPAAAVGITLGIAAGLALTRLPVRGEISPAEARTRHREAISAGVPDGVHTFPDRSWMFPDSRGDR